MMHLFTKTGKRINRLSADARAIIIRLAVALFLAVLFVAQGVAASQGLDISDVDVPVMGLPLELDGLRIAHLSDLHSSRFGMGQCDLIAAIEGFRPDLIVLTGDCIDGVTNRVSAPCLELVRGLAPIAPVYWVRGNHEYYLESETLAAFEAEMEACGARLLGNAALALQRNGVRYLLAGMDDVLKDPEYLDVSPAKQDEVGMRTAAGYMAEISEPEGDFPLRIMLCHRPHWWRLWKEAGYDIALCGHLHGGMIRLPGIGGIINSPSRFFPQEDAGLYDKEGMAVYISRGLNNLPNLRNVRINNKPELAFITVRADQD